MAQIVFENVSKRFDQNVVVDDLTLEIADGEFLVLVGPSGCGKSTALRMLAGLEDVTSGRILIDGRVVNNLAPGARDLAMVFQSYALYPHMNVYDNIAFNLKLARFSRDEIDKRVREAARILRLDELLSRSPAQLSGGQRQRVTIARALVNRPAIVWGDEPTGDLDTQNANEIMQLITDLNRQHRQTFVIVTHAPEVAAVCHRIVHMKDGQIVREEVPAGARA